MTVLRYGFNLIQTSILRFPSTKNIYGKIMIQGNVATAINLRAFSSQQLTKYLSLISEDKKPKVNPVDFKVESNTEKPLVILLTWLLAKPRHIQKFNEIYLEQGFDVLNISIAPWQILWPAKGTQVVARDVLKFLDVNPSYSTLFLHGFSVGGYVWGETLVQIAQEQTRYQHILDKICGQVWDSAADITEIPVGMPKAVFPKNEVMQNAFRQYIIYHMKTFNKIATCHYVRSSQVFTCGIVKAPALFFLSMSDPVGAYASNMRVRESWESLGIKVYWKCWEKSPHVSHFHYHRKEYLSELYSFLEKLELISFPEKIQAKL